MSFGEAPDEAHQDDRVKAAMKLAQKTLKSPHDISDEDFKHLNTLFTTEEIATISAFIGFIIGANRFSLVAGLSGDDLKDND